MLCTHLLFLGTIRFKVGIHITYHVPLLLQDGWKLYVIHFVKLVQQNLARWFYGNHTHNGFCSLLNRGFDFETALTPTRMGGREKLCEWKSKIINRSLYSLSIPRLLPKPTGGKLIFVWRGRPSIYQGSAGFAGLQVSVLQVCRWVWPFFIILLEGHQTYSIFGNHLKPGLSRPGGPIVRPKVCISITKTPSL